MGYDPKTHWLKRGETYREELQAWRRGKAARNFDAQEKLLPEMISALGVESVLEVGCGYGRMTALVSKVSSVKRYDAVDLSPHNIEDAKSTVIGVRFRAGDFMEMEFDVKYDLVFACEVLMHIPQTQIEAFARKMRDLSNRYVISLDFRVEKKVKLDPANFNHDYRDIYSRLSAKRVEQKRLESKRFYGIEVHPQSIFLADFHGS